MFYSAISFMPTITISCTFLPKCIFRFFKDNQPGDFKKNDDYQRFKGILWYIISGTRGGPNRARILNLLNTESLNAHQISKELNLDHKTVAHHLKILSKNELVKKHKINGI
ncbi:MAG: winged helix-turn-helix domain-containing protein, partial [Nitrosopumilus sp.]|nr:winged helix-turn-helix domain-containing protein [Nitrosopumilus sp.]